MDTVLVLSPAQTIICGRVVVLCARRRVGAAVPRGARGRDCPIVQTDGEQLVAFVRAESGSFLLLLKSSVSRQSF